MTKTLTAKKPRAKTYANVTDDNRTFMLYSRDQQGFVYHFEYNRAEMAELFTNEEQAALCNGKVVTKTVRKSVLRWISADALVVTSAL